MIQEGTGTSHYSANTETVGEGSIRKDQEKSSR